MFRPTDEQQNAIELFKTGDTLRIDAYAGSGKTTTLELIAHSTRRSGYYLAFGKSNQLEAEKKFPANVDCRTTNSLAYRVIARIGRYSNPKMTHLANANLIADVLGLPQSMQFSSIPWFTLSGRSYASILRDACKEFLFSTAPEPAIKHFPRYKNRMLLLCSDSEFSNFANEALPKLKELWNNMQDPQGKIPLGHEGYLKLWALARPRIEADFILLDEAQDSNPVMLEVLQNQNCQVVYVGDPYQQIYEWRGAVNAMKRIHAKKSTALTQSFRFGAAIALAATKVIAELGAGDAIRGHGEIKSDLCPVNPDAILCRTNFGVITHLIGYQAQGASCQIIGGPEELRRLLWDVRRLKQSLPPEVPEFFGFKNWDEVVEFSNQPEGEYLKSFVRLVREYGEQRLLSALDSVRLADQNCDIILSTGHKSKGREWNFVYLDNDFEKMLTTPLDSPTPTQHIEPEDARLLYVAMTRAVHAVEIPEKILNFFELTNSRTDRVGIARFNPPAAQPAQN
jgi:hypothetical protein